MPPSSVFYRGWVPTVNCRLSFRIIGETSYPAPTRYANCESDKYHYVVVKQSRDLSDVLFKTILSSFFGVSGDFDFYFVARNRRTLEDVDAPLVGAIYVVRALAPNRIEMEKVLCESIAEINAVQFGPTESAGRDAILHGILVRSHAAFSALCDMRSRVRLERNGMIRFSRPSWNSAELYETTLQNYQRESLELDDELADQMYYFVRDISHQHQHHGPDADTIIKLTKANGNDLSWCGAVVYSLYFHIIRVKRKHDSAEQIRILGVLAYLQSFKHIVKEKSKALSLPEKIPFFDDVAMANSINASKSYLEAVNSRHKSRMDTARTWLVWGAATLLTVINMVVGFGRNIVPTDDWTLRLSDVVRANAYVIMLIPFAVLFFYGAYWFVLAKEHTTVRNILRDIIRVCVYNRTISLWSLALATVGFGYLAIRFALSGLT